VTGTAPRKRCRGCPVCIEQAWGYTMTWRIHWESLLACIVTYGRSGSGPPS
jgi:hypothetical protein